MPGLQIINYCEKYKTRTINRSSFDFQLKPGIRWMHRQRLEFKKTCVLKLGRNLADQ